MKSELTQLAERIRYEMTDLERVHERIIEGLARAKRLADDYYLDSVALNLHGFYSGLERIFELIATILDNIAPQGKNWHQALLQQMTIELPNIRPAVISATVYEQLNEYRGFRHVVRNVYTFKFDPIRVEQLVIKASPLFVQVRNELLAFAQFLEQQADESA